MQLTSVTEQSAGVCKLNATATGRRKKKRKAGLRRHATPKETTPPTGRIAVIETTVTHHIAQGDWVTADEEGKDIVALITATIVGSTATMTAVMATTAARTATAETTMAATTIAAATTMAIAEAMAKIVTAVDAEIATTSNAEAVMAKCTTWTRTAAPAHLNFETRFTTCF